MKLKLKMTDSGLGIALHTEDGTILPGQSHVSIENPVGGMATVTTTFILDGDAVDLEGSCRSMLSEVEQRLPEMLARAKRDGRVL